MRRGLSIIKLLVVVGILVVLISLMIPAVFAAREAPRRSTCLSNLRQLSMAIHAKTDTDRHLLENRFFFNSDNIAAKESLWIADVWQSMTGVSSGRSESYFLCPSGFGVTRFPSTVPRFNRSETMESHDESGDCVANGGLSTPRDILAPLEPTFLSSWIDDSGRLYRFVASHDKQKVKRNPRASKEFHGFSRFPTFCGPNLPVNQLKAGIDPMSLMSYHRGVSLAVSGDARTRI